MKKNLLETALILCSLAWVLVLLPNCGGSDPNPQEERLNELTATWSVNSVVNDGSDVTNQYTGFSLTITGNKTYSTLNGGNPWPANGTFDFVNETTTDRVLRDDGVTLQIRSITASSLELVFSVTSVRGQSAGAEGITGDFTFNLQKQ